MLRNVVALIFLFAFFAVIAGCSGSGGDITIPAVDNNAQAGTKAGTMCLGAWQVAIHKTTGEVDVYQARSSDLALNVLCFLEPPALGNLTIDFNTLVITPPLIEVDVILSHPIPDPVFTGFDVRGVVFGPDVLNADGWTPYMNPDDFSDVPFGYIDGLLGAPDGFANYSDALNGFKYFADGLGFNDDLVDLFTSETNLADRGKFSSMSKNTRHYTLSWEGKTTPIDFLVFNYAVYANYNWPTGEPPFDLDDFQITANCAEAFCFSASATDNMLYFDGSEGGGDLTLDVELWDWQGRESYDVTIEAGDIFGLSPVHHDSTSSGTTSKSQVFTFTEVEGTPTSTADIEIMVTATDESATFGSSWFMNLFPPDNPLYDDYVYAVWFTTVPVSIESPVSFHIELDEEYTINSSSRDFNPGVISRTSDDRIFIGYMRYYSGTSNTDDYVQSDDYGANWSAPYYNSWGGGPSRPFLNAMAVDAEGNGFIHWNCFTSPYWSLISELVTQPPTNSGIIVLSFTHGNGLIFSHDGYAIVFGDPSNTVSYKRALFPNTPYWSGNWLCWNALPQQTAVPAPARLSHTRNAILTASDQIYVVYFSSGNDTWIKTTDTTDTVTPGTWNITDVYDGAADGYDLARDPALYYETLDGDFHCAFIVRETTNSDRILYTRSTDGTTWDSPAIAYQTMMPNILDDPTIDVVEVEGEEIIVITYLEDNDVYLVFSWDEGETWEEPTKLSDGDAIWPDSCSTSNGMVHTVWEHQVGSDIVVEYIRAQFVAD